VMRRWTVTTGSHTEILKTALNDENTGFRATINLTSSGLRPEEYSYMFLSDFLSDAWVCCS
jgi:hypothetical protein